tara:strand:+ start:2418 stop:3935 length:1518 start_codon:yes stop_codon:yes gene_type:complete
MNNKIKEKRGKIITKLNKIINNFDYKYLDYLDSYCDKNFELQLIKYIEKNEEKYKTKIEIKSLCDEYMNKNYDNYTHNSTSNIYFYYNKDYYTCINEDNMTYNILLDIQTLYPSLTTDQKFSLKKQIIKRIKINPYDEIIPESKTIQTIINYFTPIIFKNKLYSKYFLTFIGDLILKKNKESNEKCFIINCNEDFKIFLIKINKYITYFFNSQNIFNYIKIKFYNHETNNANILFLNNDINNNYLNKDTNFFITFLFICIYHSKKFENSIKFLEYFNESIESNYITQLKTIKFDELINQFWVDSIIFKENSSLKENTILFLWKKFLSKNKLPKYLLFQHNFINLFKAKYIEKNNKDIVDDNYTNISSFNVPQIELFLEFWNDNIILDNEEKYLELEEIEYCFKLFLKEKNQTNYYKYFHNNNLLEIIMHYFTNLKYENNKYFHELRLKNWDKKKELKLFNNNFKGKTKKIDNLYNNYCKYKKLNQENFLIISKIYFTTYYKTINQ